MDTYRFNDSIIFPNDKFIYEVELYSQSKNYYGLEDSKYFSAAEFIENLADCIVHKFLTYKLIKYTTLICAPQIWLNENAMWFKYESRKEIRSQKNKEKKEKKEQDGRNSTDK